MRGTFAERLFRTVATGALKPRRWDYTIPRPRLRFNSTTPSAPSSAVGESSARPVKPSILVTHGEGIFRLILVSQAVFGVLTVFWWHMHYFETQDEKNEEIAMLKGQLKRELQLQVAKSGVQNE